MLMSCMQVNVSMHSGGHGGDAGVSFITLRPISLRRDLSLGPELAVSITMVTGKS